MTNNIVSMLLEGGNALATESLTANEMKQYTLESGAALIARQSVQELHEIFEVAVVETNEAALAAYMEGNADVMESATYGVVFEDTEKKAGNKVLEFLTKLRDRVVAFFQNIYNKLVYLTTDYDKFLKNNKKDLDKSTPMDLEVMQWKDAEIDGIANTIGDTTKELKFASKLCTATIKAIGGSPNGENKYDAIKKYDNTLKLELEKMVTKLGLDANSIEKMSTTEVSSTIRKRFVDDSKSTKKIDAAYPVKALTDVKKSVKDIQSAQKAFKAAYDDAIKEIKQVLKDAENDQKSGYSQEIHKAVSMMSKMQTYINIYITQGNRALIGRANEAKALVKVLISGKYPKKDK